MNLLDLCTGTGCIPLFLCKELEGKTAVRAVGVDILPEAVGLSSENARLAGIPSSLGSPTSFTVWKDDIFHPAFPDRVGREIGKVDWLTSNPPYIPLHEIDGLDPSVREFESSLALVGDLSHLPPSVSLLLPPINFSKEREREGFINRAFFSTFFHIVLPTRASAPNDQRQRPRLLPPNRLSPRYRPHEPPALGPRPPGGSGGRLRPSPTGRGDFERRSSQGRC